MNKQAWLKLDGSLEEGFRVSIDVRDDSQIHPSEAEGKLPANPKLAQRLDEWQQSYRQLPGSKRITLDDVIVEMINPREVCLQKRDALERCFKDWLSASSFRAIERQIRGNVSPTDTLRIIVRAQDDRLHYLPWHLWDLVEEDYKNAEVALGTLAKPFARVREPGEKVRVLAILGDSEGIDTASDQKQLNLLPNADITPLSEPSRQQINDHLWDQDWDVLFFAGHSRTKQPKDKQTERPEGIIYINANDSLTIKELRYGLERAIARGLQLAIFNSCDGLGLAYKLEQLHIPQLIVMREPVPDRVAQEFLKEFLTVFAKEGKSLYVAARSARERLQGLEGEFPCASWLPVIVQNPAVIPPTWTDLWHLPPEPPSISKPPTQFWRQLLTVIATSFVVTGAVIGVRSLGWLQDWELGTYDQMLRLRPQEGPDPRLLIVAVKDQDLQLPEQRQRNGSFSDLALSNLLKKLKSYKPRAIGLDIFRPLPVDGKQAELAQQFQNNKNLFAICHVGEPGSDKSGTAPPPNLPESQQGFSNGIVDSGGVVRRHLLSMDVPPTSLCTTRQALSVQLALHYLEAKGQILEKWNFQIKDVLFQGLHLNSGAYQKPDAETWGIQVMLNYRSYRSPDQIAEIVSLGQVLRNEVSIEQVKNRIVLIGAIHSTSDYFYTPYNIDQSLESRIPGVVLQAQMTSQIISAIEDKRPLIRPLSRWLEVMWLLGGILWGLMLVWYFKSRLYFGVSISISIGLLYLICYYLLVQGYWLPFIPLVLPLVLIGCLKAFQSVSTQKQNHL